MLLLITTPDSVVKCYNMQTARFPAFVSNSQEGHKGHIYIKVSIFRYSYRDYLIDWQFLTWIKWILWECFYIWLGADDWVVKVVVC